MTATTVDYDVEALVAEIGRVTRLRDRLWAATRGLPLGVDALLELDRLVSGERWCPDGCHHYPAPTVTDLEAALAAFDPAGVRRG